MPKKLHWYHGVAFFIFINLLAFGWGIEVQNFYAKLNLPWFAPDTWVFGVVWPINVILLITGNIWAYNFYQSLNKTENKNQELVQNTRKNLKIYGILQIFSWVNYAIFQYVSFGTQIPAMFFWPTFSMWVISVFGMYFAGQIDTQRAWILDEKLPRTKAFLNTVILGKSIFFTFTTLIIWLSLASLLGYYIWMNN